MLPYYLFLSFPVVSRESCEVVQPCEGEGEKSERGAGYGLPVTGLWFPKSFL